MIYNVVDDKLLIVMLAMAGFAMTGRIPAVPIVLYIEILRILALNYKDFHCLSSSQEIY